MNYFFEFVVAIFVALIALYFIFRLLTWYVAELQAEIKRQRKASKEKDDRIHYLENELAESDKTIIELQAKIRWGHDQAQ